MSVRALIQSSSTSSSQQSQQQHQQGGNVRGGRDAGRRTNLRETIHSGHFMVSDFEPESEAQDEEYEVGMPIPPGPPETVVVKVTAHQSSDMLPSSYQSNHNHHSSANHAHNSQHLQQGGRGSSVIMKRERSSSSSIVDNSLSELGMVMPGVGGHININPYNQALSQYTGGGEDEPPTAGTAISIDGSLTKLFQCMSLAYRQKLTSPKWNRFKGVRLRWKDKIRLNNVIWRCWHMQFIMKKKTLVCQFAAPLDVDGHNKPEVCCPQAVVMEGKYWKRKLSTVAAEYKKWRLFYRNRIMGWTHATPTADLHPVSLDGFDWSRSGTFGAGMSNIIFDDDMFMDFTDTLFSSLSSNQPFAFPNPKEITRVGMVADFIQPGLVQLQPNLDDFMDTLEPLQDYVNSKLLPPVPEELENFDPPDSLLSDDVLTHNHNNQGNKGGSSSQQQQQQQQQPQNYYDQTILLPHHNGITSNEQHNNHHPHQNKGRASQQEKQLQQQQQGSSPGIFAKPQGKPRGRTRSGPGSRSSNQPSHQQQLVNNANSNTLLSHLLANSNHHNHHTSHSHPHSTSSSSSNHHNVPALPPPPVTTSSGGSGGDYGNMSPLNMIMGEQFQQFHLPAPNTPLVINFGGLGSGSGSLLSSFSGASNTSPTGGGGSGGSGGSISPPLGPPSSTTPTSNPSSPSKGARKGIAGSSSTGGGGEGSDRGGYKHRRVSHINAEQKRRCNIKNGFDTLHSLIPQLSHNPNAKVSKAAMLAKGAEYIRQLKLERAQLKDEIERHRADVEGLNASINNCQSMLPATGAPVSRQRTSKMNEMFHVWVRQRTLENWKFWLFSTLIRPLLDSYNNSVSTASVDELCRTVLAWVDQHCSLVDLRPAVLTSLRQLCTSTDILSNPGNLQEEAYKAVNRPIPQDRNNSGGGSDSSR